MTFPSRAGTWWNIQLRAEEHLEDRGLNAITPSMLLLKYKLDRYFMEFVWRFSVPVSQTKAKVRELVKMCGNNIFQADLSNDLPYLGTGQAYVQQ